MTGDFNFNLLCETSSPKQWLRTTGSFSMAQLVNRPTRVTATSETLIDHAFSNSPEIILDVSVAVLGLSDHYLVCITRKLSKAFENGPVHKFINYKNIKTFDQTQFLNALANQPWSVLNIFDDASDPLDYFPDIFNSVLSTHAPKKKRRVKRQKQPNWINTEILTAMKTRDQYQNSKNMG